MRAIVINEWGGRDRLELVTDLPTPPVAPDGVLVRVRAAGLNPVDHKIREGYLAGAFPHHFPLILGWDAAGVVEQVGPAVKHSPRVTRSSGTAGATSRRSSPSRRAPRSRSRG